MPTGRFDFGDELENYTYFYDFIVWLEREYAFASVAAIREELELIRTIGPALAGLSRSEDGVYLAKIPVGFGHFAVVELEEDRDGALQPVMAGIARS